MDAVTTLDTEAEPRTPKILTVPEPLWPPWETVRALCKDFLWLSVVASASPPADTWPWPLSPALLIFCWPRELKKKSGVYLSDTL